MQATLADIGRKFCRPCSRIRHAPHRASRLNWLSQSRCWRSIQQVVDEEALVRQIARFRDDPYTTFWPSPTLRNRAEDKVAVGAVVTELFSGRQA